jgi:hypothetical protein
MIRLLREMRTEAIDFRKGIAHMRRLFPPRGRTKSLRDVKLLLASDA